MNDIIKKDILQILSDSIELINRGELFRLRELSDHVIHNASIFQDEDSISIAIIIYAVSKIYEQEDDTEKRFLADRLSDARESLEKGDFTSYSGQMKSILSEISKKGTATNKYVAEVLERAQIKKATKIYDHGISLAQVADTLGISRWDLLDYVGKTTIPDSFESLTDVKDKVRFARKLFGGAQ
jgi:hypothetical protein